MEGLRNDNRTSALDIEHLSIAFRLSYLFVITMQPLSWRVFDLLPSILNTNQASVYK
jgi:hypothetical protein